ncbi:lipocalin family protein [Pelomonas sp. KK5]|uniref:lipocalin family protein n=1 Tax=Pelomonas sp. KK5 TaxID=1855730 RepID=UPI00097BC4FD|nr:lipocalin family protein [Pelomonas sp. KK5]
MKAAIDLRRLWCLSAIFGLCSIAPAIRAAENAPLPTVNSVDLARYVGSWYEIALLPNRFERQCVSDTQARYTAQDEGIRVLNRCRKADGHVDSAEGRAKIVAASGNAKLRVTFFWPFYGDYWILALDDDYSEVLVGTPDRRYGWILARRPDLPEARVQGLLERAKALGFDAAAFKRVPQIQPLDDAS